MGMISRLASGVVLYLSAVVAQSTDCTGVGAVSPLCATSETTFHRDVFYVGGRWVDNEYTGGNITADHLYVEKLTPAGGVTQTKPLVFFHGGAVSGVQWLNTPDNRKGFASYFLDQGYMVYLLDHTGAGRSSQEDSSDYLLWNSTTVESLVSGFTAPELSPTYPQAVLHTQWPGTGQKGDPYFTAFSKWVIPFTKDWVYGETSMRASGCALLELLGPSYLISHSSGAQYPIVISNDCPQYVAGNINLEHSTQPFWTYGSTLNSGSDFRLWGLANTYLAYDPPVSNYTELNKTWVGNDTLETRNCYLQAEPARQLPNITSVPYLCLTGEASVHMTYDHCVIAFLEQAGGNPEWIKLADRNITGNGHFSMVESNNLEIAAVVNEWIQKQEAASTSSSSSGDLDALTSIIQAPSLQICTQLSGLLRSGSLRLIPRLPGSSTPLSAPDNQAHRNRRPRTSISLHQCRDTSHSTSFQITDYSDRVLSQLKEYSMSLDPFLDTGTMAEESKPPFPPFTKDTARIKVKAAQDAWNSKNPAQVKMAYTPDSIWRNRGHFFQGRDAIEKFLSEKWSMENGYRLRKELFAFTDNKIAVQFWYEWHDEQGQWWRSYGLEHWTFADNGLMRKRQNSTNDVRILEEERWFEDGVDVDTVEISEKHW